jgi:flagellar L-ring protein precursor FlgH
MTARHAFAIWMAAVLAVAGAVPAMAADKAPKAPPTDNYDALFARYLEAARQMQRQPAAPSPSNWMTNLTLDPRARQVNDLVTIRVIESINAAGTADSSLDKESDVHAAVPNLFGLESKYPDWLDPMNIVNSTSSSDFKGGGTTKRSGALTAVVTARVVEVLPNGDLALEGVREIEINGDRQIIVLTGVVRPAAINRENVVSSAQVGQLRIRYFGRGLIKDNLQPGWLVRVFNKIF